MRKFQLTCLLVLFCTLLYAQTSCNPVADYPFSSNVNDISTNQLHGTVYDATLTTDRFDNPN